MKPLPGQRDLFEHGVTARAQHDAVPLNSTVAESDAPRLSRAHQAILGLMSDYLWHTNAELLHVGGVRYSARLEELKKAGYVWVKEHIGEGCWKYRMLDRGEQ